MSAVRVTCPHCATVFLTRTEASVPCPGCQATFPPPRASGRGVRPRRKGSRRQQAASSRTGLVLALVLGGVFLGICLPVAGVGLYWFFGKRPSQDGGPDASSPLTVLERALGGSTASAETRKLLIGTWESTEAPKGAGRRKPVLWFNEDGTVYLETGIEQLAGTFRSLGMAGDFGLRLPARCITYRLTADDRLELDVDLSDFGKKLGADPATIARDFRKKETLTIAVSAKELSITNDQGKTTQFRRLEE